MVLHIAIIMSTVILSQIICHPITYILKFLHILSPIPVLRINYTKQSRGEKNW